MSGQQWMVDDGDKDEAEFIKSDTFCLEQG